MPRAQPNYSTERSIHSCRTPIHRREYPLSNCRNVDTEGRIQALLTMQSMSSSHVSNGRIVDGQRRRKWKLAPRRCCVKLSRVLSLAARDDVDMSGRWCSAGVQTSPQFQMGMSVRKHCYSFTRSEIECPICAE